MGNDIDIGEKKNMNLPGVKVELPVLQEKDKKDLVEFGIPQGVDFVAASFVQDGNDVKLIRETLGKFPEASVKTMRRICEQAESVLDYKKVYLNMREVVLQKGLMEAVESICSS